MREYFINTDFDQSLSAPERTGTSARPAAIPEAPAALPGSPDNAYLREMPWHFLFAANPGESLLLHIPLPPGFLRYCEAKGLRLPRAVRLPDFTSGAEFVPFGWNAAALSLASRYARAPEAPALAAVKRVNSRAFALDLEREWFPGDCQGRMIRDLGELSAFLAARPASEAWVAKGDHGYAGTANRRVTGGPVSDADALRLAPLFAGHGCVVLEPWHERERDMAILFEVSPAGVAGDFRGHGLRNSRDGAFLGVDVAPDGMPPAPWAEALRDHARRLAPALAQAGYFGPVGVDAYVYRSPQGPRLRPLVDVNARLSMAMPAHGLARRLPGRFIRWSWHKPRKLRMPSGYADLEARLGSAAFDPAKGEGILAVSPLSREDEPEGKPKRVGFALVAADAMGLERLQSVFDSALGRTP